MLTRQLSALYYQNDFLHGDRKEAQAGLWKGGRSGVLDGSLATGQVPVEMGLIIQSGQHQQPFEVSRQGVSFDAAS